MGAHRQTSAPTDPQNMFWYAGILLCVTFGLVAGAIHDTIITKDWAWFWVFTTGNFGVLVLYFWIVWSWLQYMSLTGDYKDVDENVVSPDGLTEDDDYPGWRYDS